MNKVGKRHGARISIDSSKGEALAANKGGKRLTIASFIEDALKNA